MLQRSGTLWKPVARIKLPRTVTFEDYSAVALRGRRIAVLSQQSSRLWIGTLRFGDWTIADEGTTYEFPRTKKGKIKYGTLEGLCWLTDRSFVCVSDLCEAGTARKRYRKTDQSIHVFKLPRHAGTGHRHRSVP